MVRPAEAMAAGHVSGESKISGRYASREQKPGAARSGIGDRRLGQFAVGLQVRLHRPNTKRRFQCSGARNQA